MTIKTQIKKWLSGFWQSKHVTCSMETHLVTLNYFQGSNGRTEDNFTEASRNKEAATDLPHAGQKGEPHADVLHKETIK